MAEADTEFESVKMQSSKPTACSRHNYLTVKVVEVKIGDMKIFMGDPFDVTIMVKKVLGTVESGMMTRGVISLWQNKRKTRCASPESRAPIKDVISGVSVEDALIENDLGKSESHPVKYYLSKCLKKISVEVGVEKMKIPGVVGARRLTRMFNGKKIVRTCYCFLKGERGCSVCLSLMPSQREKLKNILVLLLPWRHHIPVPWVPFTRCRTQVPLKKVDFRAFIAMVRNCTAGVDKWIRTQERSISLYLQLNAS